MPVGNLIAVADRPGLTGPRCLDVYRINFMLSFLLLLGDKDRGQPANPFPFHGELLGYESNHQQHPKTVRGYKESRNVLKKNKL